jgi:hypothetical protein
MSTVIVPQHISRLAFYSAPFILFNSAVAHKYKYYKMSACLTTLTITTILHWNKIKSYGIVRKIDTILASSTIAYGTYIGLSFSPLYRTLCITANVLAVSTFYINNWLFYHQTQKKTKMMVLTNGQEQPEYETHYWYFSLLPTKPGSKEREQAYYRSTYTHIFFLHVFPTIILSSGIAFG